MKTGQKEMWRAIDNALPELRVLVGELRTEGQTLRADRLCEVTDRLAGSRATTAAEFREDAEEAARVGRQLAERLVPRFRRASECAAKTAAALQKTGLLST
jgi:hypothetical protein